jgi:hypothetical protein
MNAITANKFRPIPRKVARSTTTAKDLTQSSPWLLQGPAARKNALEHIGEVSLRHASVDHHSKTIRLADNTILADESATTKRVSVGIAARLATDLDTADAVEFSLAPNLPFPGLSHMTDHFFYVSPGSAYKFYQSHKFHLFITSTVLSAFNFKIGESRESYRGSL